MGPTLKTQAVQQELEDATDSLHQNVDNYHSTLRNIPEEWRSHLQVGGSLKSRKTTSYQFFKQNPLPDTQ